MKQNWFLICGIVAVLAIPFGLALFEDSAREPDPDSLDDEFDESEPESEEEIVAEWERNDVLDTSFLKNLDERTPGLTGDLSLVFESANRGGTGLLDEFIRDFNRTYERGAVSMTREGGEIPASLVFFLPADPRVNSELERRWGSGDAADSAVIWFDDNSKHRVVMTSFGGNAELMFSAVTSIEELVELMSRRVASTEAALKAFAGTALSSGDGVSVFLPPTVASAEYKTELSLSFDDRSANVMTVLDCSLDPTQVDAIRTHLRKRFGGEQVADDWVSYRGTDLKAAFSTTAVELLLERDLPESTHRP